MKVIDNLSYFGTLYIYSCGKLCGKDCDPKITYRNIYVISNQNKCIHFFNLFTCYLPDM